MCQEKLVIVFKFFHGILHTCVWSILANDKDIANHNGKIFRQKAAIRPQNIGLKATAAKRPHFAHGRHRERDIILLIPQRVHP